MAIAVVSILAITAVVWLANKFLPFTVCPICAGSFLTWVGLVGAYFAGYTVDLTIPAILMGGSVVGIASALEKNSRRPAGASLFFKTLFIPAGFVAAYSVLERQWVVLLFAVVILVLLSLVFSFLRDTADSPQKGSSELEKRMKDCC